VAARTKENTNAHKLSFILRGYLLGAAAAFTSVAAGFAGWRVR
jgi:hypothetical protein